MSHYPKYATIMMSNSLATKMFIVDDKDYSNKSWAVLSVQIYCCRLQTFCDADYCESPLIRK